MPGRTRRRRQYWAPSKAVAASSSTYVNIDGGRDIIPRLAVEIDFTTNPTTPARTWTGITTDVRQLTFTQAGRNQENKRVESGSLQLLLDNTTGAYDFENASSPYYPGVKRSRWIRVRAKWGNSFGGSDGGTIWTGVIESWSQQWPEAGKDATCTVTATDVFKILNLFDLAGLSFPGQSTSQRVGGVCLAAGLPFTLSTGASNLDASGVFANGSFALDHVQAVADHENGAVVALADGTVRFESRNFRRLSFPTAAGTIGDSTGEIPYQTAELDLDDVDLANQVGVTTMDGSFTATATNTASKTSYFVRQLNRSQLNNNQLEAIDAANYLANRYADSPARMPAVTLLPVRATGVDAWTLVLSAQFSSRFTWKRRATPNTITKDVFVEQIQHTIVPGVGWQVSWQLSPATQDAAWILDTSALDSTTVLSY